MTKSDRLIASLPATSDELCAVLEDTPKRINGMLYFLSRKGLVKRDPIWIGHSERRGPKPGLWISA